MKKIKHITPIVITYNEEDNIVRCLDSLVYFDKVIVVDSGSNDATLSMVQKYSNVEVVSNVFETFAQQWNFAKKLPQIQTDWILALDADYQIPLNFVKEVSNITTQQKHKAYRVSFDYSINGRILRKSLYPPIISFYDKRVTFYIDDGHCMRAIVEGEVGDIKSKIIHDDRKPLSRWLKSQINYADIESQLLLSKTVRELRIQDKLRKTMVITPWLVPIYYFIFGLGILDGRAGLYYALQRSIAESILMLKLIEKKYF